MAVTYVDTDLGSGANDGTSWANAYRTVPGCLQQGVTGAGAGGVCYFQGAAADTEAVAIRTLTSPGTIANPTILIGCKDGTTAEEPTDSDVCVRGTDTLPVWSNTGAGNDIEYSGALEVTGVSFSSADRFSSDANGSCWVFNDCEIEFGLYLYTQHAYSNLTFNNCDLKPSTTSGQLLTRGGMITMNGGLFSGTVVTNFVGAVYNQNLVTLNGVDLSYKTSGTLCTVTNAQTITRFINCELHATPSLFTGNPTTQDAKVEFINCFSGTKTSAQTTVAYNGRMSGGDCAAETGVYRDAGAVDRASVNFSYSLTPIASRTLESTRFAVETPMFGAQVAGGTSQNFDVHIASELAGDLTHDQIWMELFTPDASGTAAHDFSNDHMIAPGTTPSVTGGQLVDDDGEAWTGITGTTHRQILRVTLTPGFTGMAYCKVFYAKRSGAVIYVDPLLEIAAA